MTLKVQNGLIVSTICMGKSIGIQSDNKNPLLHDNAF